MQLATPGPDQANSDHNFFVQIRGIGPSQVMGGIWQLRVRNTSPTDTCLNVWTLDDSSSVFFTGKSVKDAVKLVHREPPAVQLQLPPIQLKPRT